MSSDLDWMMKQPFRESTHFNDNIAALSDLLAKIKKANDVSSMMYFDKAVEQFQYEIKKISDKEPHSGEAENPEAAHEEKLSDGKEI